MTATWDPSGSLCVEYKWTLSLEKDFKRNTLIQSDFLGIPEMTDKALCFGIGTYDGSGDPNYVCCYVSSTKLSELGFRPASITATAFKNNNETNSTYQLEQVPTDGDPICLLFQSTQYYGSLPDWFILRLYLKPSVDYYALYRFDARLGQQLWKSAINAQLTDVVFQVGDSTFPAHKFVMVARSSVFRAMFEADMKEARTGRVQIVDATPDIFEQFLQFLYTGQLAKPASKHLGYLAEKYDVKTLSSLCPSIVADEVTNSKGLLTFAKSKWAQLRFEKIIQSTRYKRIFYFPFLRCL